ncbi:hypothetical protein HGB24_00585 [Candidatus Saccharibacteria bacterium]|nr:hypothetical protein [Candidatus Saccharibacteria bacterium]
MSVYIIRSQTLTTDLHKNEQTQNINNPKTIANSPSSDNTQIAINSTNDKVNNSTTQESSGTVSITALSQNNDTLNIRTLISNIAENGTCTLTLSKDNSTLSFKAGIQPGPSTSTCQGFDLSISQQHITAGDWIVNITVESDTIHTSTSGRINIK